MKKTKVVCTMGPNTNDRELMRKLIQNGMDVARFNFSHGDHEEQKGRMDMLKELREEEHANTAILLDTKGPEIRTGLLKDGKDVNISSLGRFQLSIGCDEDVYSDTKNSIQKVAVRGVRFQANKELMEVVGEPTFREVARNAAIVATSAQELIPLLDEYFKTNSHITRAEFESAFNLKRATATLRLKELTNMGVIKQEGAGKDTKYIKA